MKPHHLPDPIFVNDQASLECMLENIAREATLAMDTEANSLHAYQEQVCLIQISTLDTDYLVDPLAIEDLSPLGDIFRNPEIEKIFHASEYDVIMLEKDLGFQFSNIFDTMLAARTLGREKMGLDILLKEMFGIEVDKRYQKANWGQRPLPTGMLRYAQIDTHYLIDLRNILASELAQTGRWPLAQEDFIRACQVPEQPKNQKLPPCWRGNGPQKLTPQRAAVYKKLCEYRDGIARKKNKPHFKVLSRQVLLTLAEACPRNLQEINNLKDLPHWVIQRYGSGLLDSIQAGLEAEPFSLPYPKRPSQAYLARARGLKEWRKLAAQKMGVNSAVILPLPILDAVAKENPRTQEELAQVLVEVPWRFGHFGKEILEALRKS